MSVIGKKPFVNYIVDECSSEQVELIISLLDNLGAPVHVSFKTLNNSFKGVHYVIFNLDPVQNMNVEGILIYIDSSHCGLFSFTSVSGNMSEFSLDVANKSSVQIYEHLTVEELRQVCGDAIGGGGGGGSEVASPYVLQDYELDVSEETFSCSDADAEYIFQNSPVAISLGGTIAIARGFADDDRKNDHIRSYVFFEFPDDDQIIYYELGLYWDGEEYSFDVKPTEPIGGGSGGGSSKIELVPTSADIDFENETIEIAVSSEDYAAVLDEQPDNLVVVYNGAVSITFAKQMLHQAGEHDILTYVGLMDNIDGHNGSVYYLQLAFEDGEHEIVGLLKDLGSNGGGSGVEQIYPIAIVATPSSTNIELAPAQNITLADMGEQAPGYTAAPYQTLNPVTYTKPYDAVLAEFGAGHQYLLPLISADSSMLMYGIAEGSMPVFDDDHPCAIMIQLNNGAIDSVMMISGGTYGPDGTLVATSLKGYFYSDTEFSLNANGIRDTDVAAAISAGKIPVAIINWQYKDFESWCLIKSFDEEDYHFEGEYKGNKFTLICDGSYWRVDWLPVYVEDKQLGADVDYANNKIYFRSLDAMRAMQSGLPMVKLELHDYTQVSRPLLGYLQLTLASQSDDKTECYYTSTQNENGNVVTTTIYVASGHTYASGSTIYVQKNEYYDFDEADMTNQTKLAEFYNLCPMTLRAHTVHDGLQMYRLQNDYRTEDNQIIYSCLLFGSLVEMTLAENNGTYSIGVIRYVLTPDNNN